MPLVPPELKTLLLPGMFAAPSSQSKESSFRLFWLISTNFDSISTWTGPALIALSTMMSIGSRFSWVFLTISRELLGRKIAEAPGGKVMPAAVR